VAYVGAVVRLAAFVPDHGPLQFLYYAACGLCWGLPVFPLISWMNRGK
jgi:hypothetical protein